MLPLIGAAQESQNGRGGSFHDKFLDQLAGDWNLKRAVRGQIVDSTVHAAWVLNHQFLRLDMTDDPFMTRLAGLFDQAPEQERQEKAGSGLRS